MKEIFPGILKYLNENPGWGIVLTGISVLIAIVTIFIAKQVISRNSNEANVKGVKDSDVRINQKN